MKRSFQEVSGQPRSRNRRRSAAGRPCSSGVTGVVTLPAADPEFAERLRRRLWRDFVRSNLRGGDQLH